MPINDIINLSTSGADSLCQQDPLVCAVEPYRSSGRRRRRVFLLEGKMLKKRPEMTGINNPNWKGGKPKCKNCNKKLSTRNNKTSLCMNCYQTINCPLKGNSFALGNKLSKETRLKMSHSRIGSKHWNWKGGKTKTEKYIRVKRESHPFKNRNGYVYEHRVIVEKFIKRFLNPSEVVHHINKDGYDNNVENLMAFKSDKFHKKYECNILIPENSIIFDGRTVKERK